MLFRVAPLLVAFTACAGSIFIASPVCAGQLYVGGATVSITPDLPVALSGSTKMRVAQKIESPCTATALAIETRDGDQSLGQAIFVCCEVGSLKTSAEELRDLVRAELKGRLSEDLFDKFILNATHTHTSLVLTDNKFDESDFSKAGAMSPAEIRQYLAKRLANIIVEAWEQRVPASVAWGLGHAVVAQNRRAVYADGSAKMYGNTNDKNFRGLEGYEDHGVEILYFWDTHDKLIATAINIACPAQAAEGRNAINADFWHPVREKLKKKYGEDLTVAAWIGAAGDQVPRPMYRKEAEERMRKLRGMDILNDLARRIVDTWEDVYQVVQQDRHQDVVLEHRVTTIQLPCREITPKEAATARQEVAKWKNSNDPTADWKRNWNQGVVNRYEQQQRGLPNYEMVLHAVRLGDIAIVTNDFELFTDFGVQMKARSPALQTFIIQLSGTSITWGSYLPTERAMAGGGYSAIPQSNTVGAVGGQVLVEESVKTIKSLWPSAKK